MDVVIQSWFENISHVLLQAVTSDGLARATVFLMVAMRLSGFFLVWPLFVRGMLPWSARIGLIVLLTLIVAPGLEFPPDDRSPIMVASYRELVEAHPQTLASSMRRDWSPTDLVAGMLSNAAIGAALALSIAIFLSGLKLAGEWIDRHSGLGLGRVLDPNYSSGDSGTANLICLFCTTIMLTMSPINGHLQAVRLILDSFNAIPVASTLPLSVSDLMLAMAQQSLILGLRIAVPFVVAMSLLDLTLSYVRRSSRWELASIAFVIRAGASLLVLAATLPGIQEAVMTSVQETFEIAENKIDAAGDQN